MENIKEKYLINSWLKTHSLGTCSTFRAKISEESCRSVKEKNRKRLDSFEYDTDLMGVFLKICVCECCGLKFD